MCVKPGRSCSPNSPTTTRWRSTATRRPGSSPWLTRSGWTPSGSPFSRRLSLSAPTERPRRAPELAGAEPKRTEEKKMTAVQGKDTPAGGVPVLNTERVYNTTVPADELARALADHLRTPAFATQVFRASGDRTVMQARKESLWRTLLGVAYALTVVFTPGEGQLSIGLGGHEWVDTAISGAIGLAVQPVLVGTAYGIWKEHQLDKQAWHVIDERTGTPAEGGP